MYGSPVCIAILSTSESHLTRRARHREDRQRAGAFLEGRNCPRRSPEQVNLGGAHEGDFSPQLRLVPLQLSHDCDAGTAAARDVQSHVVVAPMQHHHRLTLLELRPGPGTLAAESPGRVHDEHESPAALDVAEELVSQASAQVGPGDQARDVHHRRAGPIGALRPGRPTPCW